jgi:heterodisulfide reductase subunit D
MGEQWCCGGPAAEMGYVDQAKRFAQHNLDNWRSTGTKRVLVLDPHDYISFTEDYPKYFGPEFDIEVVLVVELFAQLIREGKLTPSVSIERAITYHDPCRLNKRKGIWKEPREILRSIPGLDFTDVDRVTQWSYCSGGGGGLPVEKPELTAAISASRVEKAAALEVDTLVSACPWSERPLGEAGTSANIDVVDIHELLAESLGITIGGSTTGGGSDGPVNGGGAS